MGNTQFLKADFLPYGEASLAEQVSGAADLMQAAFAGVAPPKPSAAQGPDVAWAIILCPIAFAIVVCHGTTCLDPI